MTNQQKTVQSAEQTILLNVGGVVLDIRNQSSVRFVTDQDPSYLNFETSSGPSTNKPDLHIVIIKNNEAPVKQNQQPLFTSTGSWSIYHSGQGYDLVLQPLSFDKPVWLAESNLDFSQITLHLHDKLFNAGQPAPPVRYPLDQILLMHYLASRQGAIVHSAGLRFQGKSYIFPGVSGAGKSTLTRSIAAEKRLEPLSDDRMIIRHHDDDVFRAYGTPWPGDAGVAENKSAPLAGILFLNKAERNRIERLSPKQAFEKLMPVTSIPWYQKEMMLMMLDFYEKVVGEIPAYDLYFAPGVELAYFLLNTLD